MEMLAAHGYGYLAPSEMFAGTHDRIAPISDWVNGLLDRCGIDSAVVAGGSFGSRVALDYALDFPARVQSLVLSGAPGSLATLRPSVSFGGKITRNIVVSVFDWTFYDRSCVSQDIIDVSCELFKDQRRVISLLRLMQQCESFDYATALARVGLPVLLIWGTHDRISPCALWRELASNARRSAFFALERCGHIPMIERPDAFNAILLDHLSQARVAAPPIRAAG